MASTYSSLKIELIGTGDQSGTWGTTTNTNLGTAIEEAITGSANVSFSSADVTLTLTDTNSSQTARNLRLNLTGTSGGARNLIVPAIEKLYLINNGLADDVTVKNSTGTGATVAAGKSTFVYNTGTNVVDAINAFPTGSVLPVASGGTGVTTSTGSTSVVLSNAPTISSPTLTGTPIAPTAAPGTNTTQIATTAFVQAATGTLGTMSTQNASSVAITGGTINGTTVGASTPAAGTFSTLTSSSVAITGGTITGTTINTVTVGSNASGTKTISTSTPTGGSDGDIWYQVS